MPGSFDPRFWGSLTRWLYAPRPWLQRILSPFGSTLIWLQNIRLRELSGYFFQSLITRDDCCHVQMWKPPEDRVCAEFYRPAAQISLGELLLSAPCLSSNIRGSTSPSPTASRGYRAHRDIQGRGPSSWSSLSVLPAISHSMETPAFCTSRSWSPTSHTTWTSKNVLLDLPSY